MMWMIIGAVACGVLGRMGGSATWDTKWRDIGVPLVTLTCLWFLGVSLSWAYVISFGLLFGALTTYWDWLFGGEDNLFFSGFMAGLSFLPFAWFGIAWWLILIRACVLAIVWGCLNRFLPQFKGRDIVEENLRYACLVITLPILFFVMAIRAQGFKFIGVL